MLALDENNLATYKMRLGAGNSRRDANGVALQGRFTRVTQTKWA